jgi:hypothetical protein
VRLESLLYGHDRVRTDQTWQNKVFLFFIFHHLNVITP